MNIVSSKEQRKAILLYFIPIVVLTITLAFLFSPFSQIFFVVGIAIIVSVLILRWPYLGAAILVGSEWASGFIDYWGLGNIRLNLWLSIGILFLILLRAKVQHKPLLFELKSLDGILLLWILVNLVSLYFNGLTTAFSGAVRTLWTGYSIYLIVKWSLSDESNYLIIGAIVIFFGFVQIWIGLDSLLGNGLELGRFRPYGQNPNAIALQIFFAVIFFTAIFLNLSFHWLISSSWLFYSLAGFAVLVATGSRSVLAATVVAMIWSFWFLRSKNKAILTFSLLVALLLGVVYFVWPQLTGRAPQAAERLTLQGYTDTLSVSFHQDTIKAAVLGFSQYPLLGIGPGNSIAYLGGYARVHNLYANTLLELGAFGILILSGMIVYSIKKAVRLTRIFSHNNKRIYLIICSFIASVLIGQFGLISLFHGTLFDRQYFILFAILESLQIKRVPDET